MERRASSNALVGTGLGALGALALASLLVGVRGDISNANVALILVVPVLLGAAVGGRWPGAFSALVATASFDFFHTRPYLSLTMDSHDDIETAVILLVVALIVAEIAVRARRHHAEAAAGKSEVRRIHRVAEMAAAGAPIDELVLAVRAELVEILQLVDCLFEQPPFGSDLPQMERSGFVAGASHHRYLPGGFALPAEGVELPILGRGRQLGRFVLVPDPGVGVSLERRMTAVALSDQLGAALAGDVSAVG